ncbi:hypothetical protein GW17_00018516 [Ensete ventricosum]|nr:hypothetical protein GW17_00018516 [Ensete ventricosum]
MASEGCGCDCWSRGSVARGEWYNIRGGTATTNGVGLQATEGGGDRGTTILRQQEEEATLLCVGGEEGVGSSSEGYGRGGRRGQRSMRSDYSSKMAEEEGGVGSNKKCSSVRSDYCRGGWEITASKDGDDDDSSSESAHERCSDTN